MIESAHFAISCFQNELNLHNHVCICNIDLHLSIPYAVFRCDDLLELIALWNKYESEVKGLLDWITDEANKFSKQVTTKGDEGVEDYIQACKVKFI